MATTINQRTATRTELFRVWPDGTVQHVDEPRHLHMSDDYVFVWAADEDDALNLAKVGGVV